MHSAGSSPLALPPGYVVTIHQSVGSRPFGEIVCRACPWTMTLDVPVADDQPELIGGCIVGAVKDWVTHVERELAAEQALREAAG